MAHRCPLPARSPSAHALLCRVAPEVLMGGTGCTSAVDVFSFGVLLWSLMTGERGGAWLVMAVWLRLRVWDAALGKDGWMGGGRLPHLGGLSISMHAAAPSAHYPAGSTPPPALCRGAPGSRPPAQRAPARGSAPGAGAARACALAPCACAPAPCACAPAPLRPCTSSPHACKPV